MKIVNNNQYIELRKFNSSLEVSNYISRQAVKYNQDLSNGIGEYNYCLEGRDSLTSEILFLISLSSDYKEDDITVQYWNQNSLIIICDPEQFYMLDETTEVIKTLELVTPLIGLTLLSNNYLLILEEARIIMIDHSGNVIKEESLNLFEDFRLDGNLLYVETELGSKLIKLE